jgi:hypothetical protein
MPSDQIPSDQIAIDCIPMSPTIPFIFCLRPTGKDLVITFVVAVAVVVVVVAVIVAVVVVAVAAVVVVVVPHTMLIYSVARKVNISEQHL